MNSVDPAVNADAGPSQPRQADPQTANITVLANRRFPVPPSYYVEFTPERWKRYQRIRSDGGKSQVPNKGKEKVLGAADGTDALPATLEEQVDQRPQERSDIDDLAIFQPPRIDWIKREDSWNAFGRVYQVGGVLDVAAVFADSVLANLEKTKGNDSRRAWDPEFQTAGCREYVHLRPE
jgi:hypothetical protein